MRGIKPLIPLLWLHPALSALVSFNNSCRNSGPSLHRRFPINNLVRRPLPQRCLYFYTSLSPPRLPEVSIKTDVGNQRLPGPNSLAPEGFHRACSPCWGLQLQKTLKPALKSLPRKEDSSSPADLQPFVECFMVNNNSNSTIAVPGALASYAQSTWCGSPAASQWPLNEVSHSRFVVGKKAVP